MPNVVLVERSEGIATVTMNRPEAMNALSFELRRALVDVFREIAGDDSVGAVVLTGAGRAFSAGVDLKELSGESGPTETLREERGTDIVGAMHSTPQPIIGAVNGFAITGGFEIALACDLLIASRDARFADTHARVGILPGWGLSQKLARLIGVGRAKEVSLTGNFLSSETAAAWGLVNRVVDRSELIATCRKLARDMMSCDPETMRGYKALIDRGFAMPFEEALAYERKVSAEHMTRVDPAKIASRRRAIQERGRGQG